MKLKTLFYNISILMLLILLVPYSYCGASNTYLTHHSSVAHATDHYSYSSHYGYDHLTNKEKHAYLCFLKELQRFDHSSKTLRQFDSAANEYIFKTFNLDKYKLPISSVKKAYASIRFDHPEYFWIGYTFRYTSRHQHVHFFTINIPKDYANAKHRKTVWHKIQNAINSCLTHAKQYDTKFEKEKYYHDTIIHMIDYANSSRQQAKPWTHSIEGVFLKKGAVCEGYSKAFQLLLNASGIENIYVTGTSQNQPHAWNVVNLGSTKNKKWYQVDLTWDDLGGNDSSDDYSYSNYITYEFFNCTKEHFPDHRVCTPHSEEYLYSLPTYTTDSTYNYYQYMNSIATKSDASTLKFSIAFLSNAIQSALKHHCSYVYLSANNKKSLKALYKVYQKHSNQLLSSLPDSYLSKLKIDHITYHPQPYQTCFCIPLIPVRHSK